MLSDAEIRSLCLPGVIFKPMIEPFTEGVSGNGIISYGLTSAGYDLRLGNQILMFKPSYGEVVNPKRFKDDEYRKKIFDEINFPGERGELILPPHSYCLGHTLEYLRIPRNMKARVLGKSTLARCAVLINTTPLEPGWEGHLTIEISNLSPCPVMIFIGEGICQMEVERVKGQIDADYAERGGKYQGQIGVVPARVN